MHANIAWMESKIQITAALETNEMTWFFFWRFPKWKFQKMQLYRLERCKWKHRTWPVEYIVLMACRDSNTTKSGSDQSDQLYQSDYGITAFLPSFGFKMLRDLQVIAGDLTCAQGSSGEARIGNGRGKFLSVWQLGLDSFVNIFVLNPTHALILRSVGTPI
jgi:hypothetical protein